MADNIVDAQVVIHDGSLVIANGSQNYDLLQALKGAGANSFGIFQFSILPCNYEKLYFL